MPPLIRDSDRKGGRALGAVISIALASALLSCMSSSQTESSATPTTIEVFQRLAERIGEKAADSLMTSDTTSISIVVIPQSQAWFLERSFARAFTLRGYKVTGGSDRSVKAEFGVEHLGVTYEDIRRTWFLGSRIVTRKTSLQASVKLRRDDPEAALLLHAYSEVNTDTVYVSDIPNLESPVIPATQGVLPSEGFFTSFIEPVIVAASIGVAVYLLFSVRS